MPITLNGKPQLLVYSGFQQTPEAPRLFYDDWWVSEDGRAWSHLETSDAGPLTTK